MRIPLDLVAIIGRNEIWNPLNTADFAEARRYCFPARAELQEAFAQARRRRDTHGRLSGEEALHIVRTWFRETDRRAANMDFGLLGDDVRAALGETEQDLLDLIEGGDGETIEAALDRALISGGWPARAHHIGSISTKRIKVVEVDGSAQAELSELMRRALVELARRRRERLRGSPNGVSFDPLFDNGASVHPVAGYGHDARGLTLDEMTSRFLAEKAPAMSAREQAFRGAGGGGYGPLGRSPRRRPSGGVGATQSS